MISARRRLASSTIAARAGPKPVRPALAWRTGRSQSSAKRVRSFPRRAPTSSSGRIAQPVPDAGFCDQVPRPRRIRLELGSDVGDVDTHVVGFVAIFGSPHLAQELAVGYEPSLVLGEHAQQVELDRGEVD